MTDELWRWKAAAQAEAARVDELTAESNALRQQLAERDATIERLEAGIPRIQEQSHQMRKKRDQLARLLRAIKAALVDRSTARAIMVADVVEIIDAALAEVNK